jgi:hypothetical protein
MVKPQVHEIASDYINQLPEKESYTKENIQYLVSFTDTTTDRGFPIFYNHGVQVDAIMGKGFAHGQAERVINSAEFEPSLKLAELTGTAPDFKHISASITKKYNARYAEETIITGKVKWFEYLVNTKKDDQYRPNLIGSYVTLINTFKVDTVASQWLFINNTSYNLIFLHSDERSQLQAACKWMDHVIKRDTTNYIVLDTYASVLYKAGEKVLALKWADRALQIAEHNKSVNDTKYEKDKIEAMHRNEKIWLEKEFQ